MKTGVHFLKVPKEYMSHFIRGYFDGDGYINYHRYFISFVGGSEVFMVSLRNEINNLGFETNFTMHDTYYRGIKVHKNAIRQRLA
ncbi:LAGLIDADG family homing endonuclease [Virgibacillus salinus]|uniref:LAGLIDADG family homing endonuclease n=1 Tax=Virgibacillus salinus TaxID=553311 RepID=UPI0034A0B1E2